MLGVDVVAAARREGRDAGEDQRGAAQAGPHDIATKVSRSWRVSTPMGLPSSCTSTASAFSSRETASAGRLGRADGRQRGGHVVLDAVGHLGGAGEQRVEQRALRHRARDLGGHDRRLGADDGHLADAVLLQDVDGLGDGLAGVGVHEVGQLAGLAAQHLADGAVVGLRAGGEAVLAEPLVVEDLGEVAAAGVGQQHHDDGVGAALGGELVGELARGAGGHAARAADEHAPPRGRGGG